MICPKCHAENADTTIFCIECGEFLNPENPDYRTDEHIIDTQSKKVAQSEVKKEKPIKKTPMNEMIDILREAGVEIQETEREQIIEHSQNDNAVYCTLQEAIGKTVLLPFDEEEEKERKKIDLYSKTEADTDNSSELNDINEDIEEDTDDFEHTRRNLKNFMFFATIAVVISAFTFIILSVVTQTNINPDSSYYVEVLNTAISYENSKEYDKAEKLYLELIEYDPSISTAYYELAKLYEETGDKESAERISEQGYINTGDTLLF